jgi:tetratricopeptide (TPR) repeat protein
MLRHGSREGNQPRRHRDTEICFRQEPRDVFFSVSRCLCGLSTRCPPSEAASALQDVLKIHGAHYQLGKIALQQKRIDEALSHLETCTRLDPDNKGAHYQLSRAFRLKGDDEQAERELAAFRALGSQVPDDAAWREQRLERIGTRRAGVLK